MVTDTPTGSITGQQDWEWNQRRTGTRSDGAGRATSSPVETERSGGTRPDRDTLEALHQENQRLESEVTRMERRLACVIDQYERRLTEKNRKQAPQGNPRSDGSEASLIANVRRWFAER